MSIKNVGNFPIHVIESQIEHRREIKFAIELVSPDYQDFCGRDHAICELKKMGFRPANIKELLMFDEKYPTERKKSPIIALGTLISLHHSDQTFVPCLSENGLEICKSESRWVYNYCFAVVRK